MKHGLPRLTRWALFLSVSVIRVTATDVPSAHGQSQTYGTALTALNPDYSVLAAENKPLLYERLVQACDRDRVAQVMDNLNRDFSDALTVYYMRQEIQALVDVWRATGKVTYLNIAKGLAQQAIAAATANPRPLIIHGEEYRGDWPCFYLPTVQAHTNGHSQLCDFQGAAGLMLVARAMQQANQPGWEKIAGFVDAQVLKKWLQYKPTITAAHLKGPSSYRYLLTILNSGRDVREHFACICMDLARMGYNDYPYWDWATFLVELYLAPRYADDDPAPYQEILADRLPANWGLFVHIDETGCIWLSIPNYDPDKPAEPLDTSHANRAVWLATRAYAEGLIDKTIIEYLANTLRFRIWAPEKGPFHFNNYVDGSDGNMNGLSSGRGGNVWFGWHRLAAYNPFVESLFLSMAYDLSDGGPNLPIGAQNKTMPNASTCLQAWAARLLAAKGRPIAFP